MNLYSRYLDPKNDLSFKKIFGSEKHKEIPIHFLNAVFELKEENQIIDLEFLETRQPPEIEARKESIVDVLVRDQKGIKYVVEMQVSKIEGFEKRAQYYAAKTYCAHFGRGGKYRDLKQVIFLAITDYIVFPEKKDRYKSNYVILDHASYEHDLKDFSFTFVELPKFQKKLDELKTIEDRWYYFLKHADASNDIEEIVANHPEIKQAYEVLDRFHWTEAEIEFYEKISLDVEDRQGIAIAARKEGLEEGRQEGLKEGLKEGRQEEQEKITRAMLKEGLPIDQISKWTGLSVEEIRSFQC